VGITVREMMNDKFFAEEYVLIAGSNGVDRIIHAATVFDSPDGYKWFRGKELVLTTGYLFVNNIELFKEVILFLNSKNVAGIGIKTSRYLKKIPKEIIDLANSIKFPIIEIPYYVAWIDIISQINSIAINRFITSVIEKTLLKDIPLRPYNLKKKVDEILICLYNDIKIPVSVLNLVDRTIFTYPGSYIPSDKCINYSPIEVYDFSFRKDVICDKPNIFRYTDLSNKNNGSWLVLPVTIRGLTISKIIIWEKDIEIDYYSLFSLKVGIALLYELYEHIYSMNSIEGRYYDEFIGSLINNDIDTIYKVRSYINNFMNFSLSLDSNFICICIKQKECKLSLFKERERLFNTVLYKLTNTDCIYGIIDDNTIVILYDVTKFNNTIVELRNMLKLLLHELNYVFTNRKFKIGIGDVVESITKTKKSFMEARKAIEIGSYLYPEESIIAFVDLGPFGMLRFEDIERKSFGSSFNIIAPLLKEDNSEQLIETLKVYLECNLNCSKTASKLFIHNNTVRYRINRIQELCNINLENYIERLKIEITLRFLDMIE
jgi:purine catabolism regulator